MTLYSLRLYCIVTVLSFCTSVMAQDYVVYLSGDSADVQTVVQPAFVLAGGGPDNDEAMRWMLSRTGGGDVVVIRASGSDGYNPYFYSELGVPVNSVETIVFRNRNASYSPYIVDKLSKAELIWIAGGDQGKYYDYWAGTPVGDILVAAANAGNRVMGGTSAGMMILGGIVYAPVGTGVISGEALQDPYHFHMAELRYNTFIQMPLFKDVVFDTHFDQRERDGRTLAFLARAARDQGIRARAIACNEHTAVCLDTSGMARIFGDPNSGEDYAYFLEANCEQTWQPQTVEAGKPLTWTQVHGNAVVVQKIAGTHFDSAAFDLKKWKSVGDAQWMYWQVSSGVLEKKTAMTNDCRLVTSSATYPIAPVTVYPNPVTDIVHFEEAESAVLTSTLGSCILSCENCTLLKGLDSLTRGTYLLKLDYGIHQKRKLLILH